MHSKYFDAGETPSLFVLDRSTGRLTPGSSYTPLYQQFRGAVRLSRVYVRPDQLAAGRGVVLAETGGLGEEDPR